MEQILIVTHRNGTTFALRSKGNTVCSITGANQNIELNAGDTVTVDVQTTDPLPFAIGDKITVYGKTYTLNVLPKITKSSKRRYTYQCTFEGSQYLLLNTAWQMPFSAINDTYTGDLEDFATLLVSNLVRNYGAGTWVLGSVPSDTAIKTLNYTDTNCLDVLQQVCSEWEVEFSITNSGGVFTLAFATQVGDTINHTFTYGRVGGGYELQRNGVNDPDFGTRIYFYGGSNNIPNSYFNSRQSPRLCLAQKIDGNTTQNNPTKNNSYFQSTHAVAKYGKIERIKVFEDIYPNRIGTVTAIDANNEKVFFDNTMFELDKKTGGNTDYLIPGTTAKVHFNTGQCAGYDFDIAAFKWKENGTTIGRFTIKAITDENNYTFPSSDNNAFRIAVGDEYIITDINLPNSYITAAQNELQTAAGKWYNEHCAPALEYTLNLDQFFVKRLAEQLEITDGVVFHIGDKVTVTDADFGISNEVFRITSLQRDLTKDYAYTLKIAQLNLQRGNYNWQRRRRIIPDIVERLRLNDIGRAAMQANDAEFLRQAAMVGENNTGRIAIIIDDNNVLRPAIIANDAIVTRMIAASAVTTAKLAGNITREKLALDALVNFERFTPTIISKADGATIAVSAGTYRNSFVGNEAVSLTATDITQDYKGNAIDPTKNYYLYVDYDEKKVIAYETEITDKEKAVYIGMASAIDATKERIFTLATQATEQPLQGNRTVMRNGNASFTLTDEILSARAIRNFVTGSDTGTLNIKDDAGADSTLLAVIGAQLGNGLRYKVGDLVDKVGEDAQDTGGLLYRAAQLESGRGIHMGKINELIDSIYSANQILVSIQNKFNTVLGKLKNSSIITQTEEENLTLGIQQCTWNPLQQVEQCSASPSSIGVPTRLQN